MKLEEVAAAYVGGRMSRDDAYRALMLEIFTDRARFGLGQLSDEDFSDFLQDSLPVIFRAVTNYNADCGEFTAFLYVYIRTSLCSWLKGRAQRQTRDESLCFCSSAELDDWKEKCEEECFSWMKSFSEAEEFRDFLVGKDGLKKQGGKFFRDGLLVLAIKSAAFIDDEMTEKVAELTGLGKARLTEMLDFARKTIAHKEENVNVLKERREGYWYDHCRYRLERKKLHEGTSLCEAVGRKYESYTKKLNALNKRLSERVSKLSPTNETVANLLGMDKRHVGYMIKHMERQVDRFNAKCYSAGHENISCNGQSEQKTGNE